VFQQFFLVEGMTALDMNINREAVSMITGLSQGLPHYTHLLSQ